MTGRTRQIVRMLLAAAAGGVFVALALDSGVYTAELADDKPGKKEADKADAPTLLGQAIHLGFGERVELKMLALWQLKLVKPEAVEAPADSQAADLMFVAVESETDKPDQGHVVWAAYGRSAELDPKSAPIYYAWDIVWDLGTAKGYAVCANTRGSKVELSAYLVDAKADLSPWPLKWDLKDPKRKNWPSGARPLASAEFPLPREGGKPLPWGVSAVKAIMADKDLIVMAQRVDTDASVLYFRYSNERKEWTQIRLRKN